MSGQDRKQWTDQELRALIDMEASDPTSWPDLVHEERRRQETLRSPWEDQIREGWPRVKHLLLEHVVSRRVKGRLLHVDCLILGLQSRLERESMEAALLRRLQDAVLGLWLDVIEECQRIVPRLNELVPFDSDEEFAVALDCQEQ